MAITVIVHELGHCVASWFFGLKVTRVGAGLHGVYIAHKSGPPLVNALIAFAGPAANLVLAAMSGDHGMAVCNVVVAVGNLLPFISHSDGSHIVNELMGTGAAAASSKYAQISKDDWAEVKFLLNMESR